jgi:hypothetical protein
MTTLPKFALKLVVTASKEAILPVSYVAALPKTVKSDIPNSNKSMMITRSSVGSSPNFWLNSRAARKPKNTPLAVMKPLINVGFTGLSKEAPKKNIMNEGKLAKIRYTIQSVTFEFTASPFLLFCDANLRLIDYWRSCLESESEQTFSV